MVEVTSITDAPAGVEPKRGRGRPRKISQVLDSVTLPEPDEPKPAPGGRRKDKKAAGPPPEFAEDDEPERKPDELPTQDAEPFPPIQPKTNFETLANYWNNILTKAQRQHGTVYLYRLHPRMKLIPWRGGRLVNANCEKFNDEDGPISRELIRARRRAGVYLLRLSQRVIKPTCELSQCEVEIRGDYTEPAEMPILDPDNLDVTYEGNREYVRVLKSRGILKATDADNPEGADEMAASEVLGNLTNKALDMLGNQQQQPAADPGAANVGSELVGLLREQINVNRPPEQQGTVNDHVNSLVTLARSMAPAAVDLKPLMELQAANNEIIRAMLARDVERAEAAAEKAHQEALAYKSNLPQPKTLREQLTELRELEDLFRGKRPGGPPAEDEDEDEDEDEQQPAAAVLGGFAGLIAALAPQITAAWREFNTTLALMKGQPIPAPIVAAEPAPPPPPPPAAPPADTRTAGDKAAATDEEARRREQMEMVVVQLQALEKPMMKAFGEGQTGAQFAAFVNQHFGPSTIHIVAGVPKETVFNMLSTYPPVWSIVGPRIAEFHKFYDDFLAGAVPAAGTVQ